MVLESFFSTPGADSDDKDKDGSMLLFSRDPLKGKRPEGNGESTLGIKKLSAFFRWDWVSGSSQI